MVSEIARRTIAGLPRKRRFFERGAFPSLDEERSGWEDSVPGTVVPGVAVRRLPVEGVDVEWYEPASPVRADAVVLYFHGGGFYSGSTKTHRAYCSKLAAESGIAFASVEYSLAPESRYPAQEEEAERVAARLAEQGKSILFGGDSAGACLAMAAAIRASDADAAAAADAERRASGTRGPSRKPAGLLLVSPWLDLTQSGATMDALDDADPLIFREDLDRSADFYCLPGQRRQASALGRARRADYPLHVDVGTREVLLDDARSAVAEWEVLGGDAEMVEREGMWHAYQLWGVESPEEIAARSGICAFVRGAFGV